mgnify:CR=1 FL=1
MFTIQCVCTEWHEGNSWLGKGWQLPPASRRTILVDDLHRWALMPNEQPADTRTRLEMQGWTITDTHDEGAVVRRGRLRTPARRPAHAHPRRGGVRAARRRRGEPPQVPARD